MWEIECAGMEEVAGGFRAFFEDSVPLELVKERLGGAAVSVRREAEVDWEQASRDAFPPLEIGERWFLAAPWFEGETPAGRIRLEMNPGMACGTGYHPCTQMCLEAMERLVKPGMRVLDVGSGSGVLSEAAGLLGAGFVVGCDIDEDAVRVARERVKTAVYVGSADAARGSFFDLVVANISAPAAEDLMEEFRRVGAAGSLFILSGFEEREMGFAAGLDSREVLRKDGWVCLVIG